ncbi:MAG: carbonic anhydrase family protein [Gammaproteobacteria bacterium]|nr:carbonic anhydrase family protein [Gammaproteobacteria bacterium]MDH5800609.1 carbonic anhydrase family protein [Gammaproteobacteria bacterium]
MKLMKLFLIAPVCFSSVALAGSGHDHWGYGGSGGPDNWGSMKAEYAECSSGKRQSPIDINHALSAKLSSIKFNYQPSLVEVLNNGHTIQVNNNAASSIKVGTEQYDLLQFHFHSPSENTVGNKPYDMEMHLVHKNKAGELAVVGVFLKAGSNNKQLDKFWGDMPQHQDRKMLKASLNPKHLLPANKSFYHFKGSLTTPPCSEGVNWFVMKNPVQVSKQQIKQFLSIVGENARPVQAANGRFVLSKN